jgi:hypothetical protein
MTEMRIYEAHWRTLKNASIICRFTYTNTSVNTRIICIRIRIRNTLAATLIVCNVADYLIYPNLKLTTLDGL